MSGPESSSPHAASRLGRRALVSGVVAAASLGLIVAVVGLVLDVAALIVVGLVVVVVGSLAWSLMVRSAISGAVRSVLAEIAARPLDTDDAPRLANVVEGICVASGVAEPELWAISSPMSNAMALDAGGRSALVVTDGLVDGLGLVELEGVVANLLGRLRDGSARLATTAAGLQQLPLSSVVAPERFLASGLGEQYAVRSDLEAVRLTRYPPGLRAALDRAATSGTTVSVGSARLDHLWLAPVRPSLSEGAAPSAQSAAQPLELRIAVLDEL